MSWYSKVFWSEGLFLRPHHLQQNDRYVEHLLERRVGHVTPYPWGFSSLEIDRDLAQQSKFRLRRASGVLPDGTPFDIPGDSPIPDAIDVPDTAAGQIAWLSMPAGVPRPSSTPIRRCASRRRSTSLIRASPSSCGAPRSPVSSGSASRASSRS